MNEVKDKSAEMKQLTGLLVGDELGIIRRLELDNQAQTARTRTINREILERPSPEHAILAICRFDRVNQTSPGFQHQNRQHLLLITSRNRKLHLYDSIADRLHSFEANRTDGQIVGAAPFATNHIVVCYADGAIHIQNVEREMILIGADKEGNTKALKVLGIEDKESIEPKAKKAKKERKKADNMDCSRWHVRILQQAHLNVFQCSLECFEVHGNRLAVAGKGFDLKVYDLTTPEGKNACIFTAQPPAPNQLGIRSPIWISGLTWLAPNNPELVATCWRTEPVVRIYDIRLDGKAVMSLDLRDRSAVHPNPPAFTCISTTGGDVFGSGLASSPGHKKEQLLIGSTVGRLICVDVRLGPHTFQTAGSFKGFGGSVRDVVYIAESQSIGRRSGRVVSCCLDRFVRVHEMRDTGFEKSKALIGKFYLKTRPTCFQPLFNCESFPQDSSLPPENDD